MSNLAEQFSEARQLQLETQFNFFRSFAGNAFDGVERIIALNIEASRASLEKSSALMRQMMEVKDPRDLFALTGQTQSQFDSALAYGRQLFGIATSVAAATAPLVSAAAPVAREETAAPESVMAAPEAVFASEPAAAPIAEPTPIAKAAGTPAMLPKPSAASFPVPSSSKPIAVASVKPVDAEPPHAPVSGTPDVVTRHAAAAPAKPARKK